VTTDVTTDVTPDPAVRETLAAILAHPAPPDPTPTPAPPTDDQRRAAVDLVDRLLCRYCGWSRVRGGCPCTTTPAAARRAADRHRLGADLAAACDRARRAPRAIPPPATPIPRRRRARARW
jgi:hypothetical protein